LCRSDGKGLTTATHASNLFALLRYVHQVQGDSTQTNYRKYVEPVQRWLVFQCWPKLSHRLRTSTREWGKNPVDILRKAPLIQGFDLSDDRGLIPPPASAAFLTRYLPLVDQRFWLNASTASKWLQYIGDTVAVLRRMVPESETPSDEHLDNVHAVLVTLKVVLDYEPIKRLFRIVLGPAIFRGESRGLLAVMTQLTRSR
jgi:hypothetical protein